MCKGNTTDNLIFYDVYYYVALPKTKLVTLYFKKCRKNSASLNYSMGVGGMTKKSYIRTHV